MLVHWLANHPPGWASPGAERLFTLASNPLQTFALPGWTAIALSPIELQAHSPWQFGLAFGGMLGLCIPPTLVVRRWLGRIGLRRHRTDHLVEAAGTPTPADFSRREALLGAAGLTASIGAGSMLVRATLIEPWQLRTVRYEIPIEGLPDAADGLRIAHLTDFHLGPRVPGSFVARSVREALALRPDLVVLTGDYVQNGRTPSRAIAELLAPLSAVPSVGVLGNHDWRSDAREMARQFEGVGIRMIDNGRVWYDAGSRELVSAPGSHETLCLAGVGDLLCDVVDPDRALHGVDERTPRLLLSHNPDVAELPHIRPHRVDLMLSGHTHGGQVLVPGLGRPIIPSRYGQKYARGLVRGPHCRVLVSSGVGMSGLPVRLGVPPEIALITLRRA